MRHENLQNAARLYSQDFSRITNIELLENGDRIFDAMIDSIEKADNYIFFETFMFKNDEVGKRFTSALEKANKKGVQCYVLLDGFGAKDVSGAYIKNLRSQGIQLVIFNPFTLKNFLTGKHIDNRTHRKLMIIDGKTGYIGGVGISKDWSGDACSPEEWRDLHFKVQGTIVNQLQSAFYKNWLEYSSECIELDHIHYESENNNGVEANLILSTPTSEYNSTNMLLKSVFKNAEKSIKIITPYFIPTEEASNELINAKRRGVNVEIIVPGEHIDRQIAKHCSRHMWKNLLQEEIRIFEYQPTFTHAKLIMIDDYMVTVGSLNLDYRSLKLNNEANMNVFCSDFSSTMAEVFEKDKEKCRRYTLKMWNDRSLKDKTCDYLASFFKYKL